MPFHAHHEIYKNKKIKIKKKLDSILVITMAVEILKRLLLQLAEHLFKKRT